MLLSFNKLYFLLALGETKKRLLFPNCGRHVIRPFVSGDRLISKFKEQETFPPAQTIKILPLWAFSKKIAASWFLMNIFLFFLGICGQKDNHIHENLQCISVCLVRQLSQTLLPTDPQKCLGENEKQPLISLGIFFKLEYLKTEAMVTSLITEFFLLVMKWEYRVGLCFCVDFLWKTFSGFSKALFSGFMNTIYKISFWFYTLFLILS